MRKTQTRVKSSSAEPPGLQFLTSCKASEKAQKKSPKQLSQAEAENPGDQQLFGYIREFFRWLRLLCETNNPL